MVPAAPPSVRFQIPMAEWLRGDFGGFVRSTWHDSGAEGLSYFQPGAVDRLLDEHRRGRADHSRILYAATVFALWWAQARATLSDKAPDAD